jgi:3-oxoacyl-[acyl-carrier protein] reductase
VEAAEAVVRGIRARGGRALAVRADVADAAQVRDMIVRVVSELGDVDILVNNAGVYRRGDLGDFDFGQLEAMRQVNVDGLVTVTRAVMGRMKERGFGRIENVASVAGLGTAAAGTTFYAATKAAVIVLTRRFAMELGPHGVTVNAVAPGFVPTDMAAAGRTRGRLRGDRGQGNGAARRQAGGHRQCRRVPRVARLRVRHRPGPHGGRRPYGLHRTSLRRRAAPRT